MFPLRSKLHIVQVLTALLMAHDRAQADPNRVGAVDPCATYRKVRPLLAAVLPLLAFVPVYGPPLVAAFQLLGELADRACPSAVSSALET